MNFVKYLETQVKKLNTKTIVLIDGQDQRTKEAAEILKKYKNIKTILLTDKPIKSSELTYLNINDDPAKIAKYVEDYVVIRKGKETKEQAQVNLQQLPYYAMMMLHNDEVDAVVGGLNYSTADILRAAFKAIGPKAGVKTISSLMIMHKGSENYIFGDISINIKPTEDQLVEIAQNTANFAKSLNIEPKVAFLSFSTNFSAKSDESILVHNATEKYNSLNQENIAIGDVQFDAAFDTKVRAAKYKLPSFEGRANIFIFPTLDAGNIGYKIAQRLGGFGAIGPIVTGTKKVVNDLSRGSSVDDVVNTVLISALQTEAK
ncbi:phosphate acetyltransferase [Mycoplasmopsis californica]|uniref:Phosphate acetyltransferase n=1 Tax=Mycoplasmopsis equigenitalium TaxID=114883 RepID=A0ABY5J192_9BACT|nr:phosphate acetyltransferase [Mycoplasmopsis equigenitalium]UUD37018.1 phosphate acetyltransferase [Mycoplasmopsis equigenitalium]VEU69683.1 phosphate acetyltransferase [Mycoplasmopsis californica]